VLGVNGSGYTRPGSAGSRFADRIRAAVATDPDVVVVQGSLNERHSSQARLTPSVRGTLTRLREEVGDEAVLVVLGASYNPGTPAATIDWINETLAGGALAAEARFVDPAEENWTDPEDPAVWADPIHPNDTGHRQIADRLAPILSTLVEG
jgi:lysophospholipase L1-like esterase